MSWCQPSPETASTITRNRSVKHHPRPYTPGADARCRRAVQTSDEVAVAVEDIWTGLSRAECSAYEYPGDLLRHNSTEQLG